MNEAIKRIEGYACRVDQGQWEEVVRVADEVGVKVWEDSRVEGVSSGNNLAQIDKKDKDLCLFSFKEKQEEIVYPDFIAKLKGAEKWEPKNGEEVECRDGVGTDWFSAKFIGNDGQWSVCRPEHHPLGRYTTHNDTNIRPLRPTLTRFKAEAKLKELGVNVRIAD